jgi:hypothetical protein
VTAQLPRVAGAPSEAQWRGLARSSPWRWRELAFVHRRRKEGRELVRVEAVLSRPDRLVTRVDGGVERSETAARPTRGRLTLGGGRARSRTEDAPWPWELPVDLDADGFLRTRPADSLMAQDPMWQDYLWVAMLDPHELADGDPWRDVGGREVGEVPEVSPPGTVLRDLAATERNGRPTWWAVVAPTESYDPRCTCCALLWGDVAQRLLAGEGGPPVADDPDPTTEWLVGLDLETGVVVSLEALDGAAAGDGFTVDIASVDRGPVGGD